MTDGGHRLSGFHISRDIQRIKLPLHFNCAALSLVRTSRARGPDARALRTGVIFPVRSGHPGARPGRVRPAQKKLFVQCFFAVRAVRPASTHR